MRFCRTPGEENSPFYRLKFLTIDRVGNEEYLFEDQKDGTGRHKSGYRKVIAFCKLAASEGYRHAWIDTCCIDKSSSAELSEAINSMFAWYRKSEVCFVYLDINIEGKYPTNDELQEARWTSRGWTLQELIAPEHVVFYTRSWEPCGTRQRLARQLSEATGISDQVLDRVDLWGGLDLSDFSVAQRMSWVSRRQTTRPEDIAYCLFGIFRVHLPPLYGEGAANAFLRLQEEIIKHSTDLSILAWSNDHLPLEGTWSLVSGALALTPAWFASSKNVIYETDKEDDKPFKMTNRGLRVTLPLIPLNDLPEYPMYYSVAVLPNCYYAPRPKGPLGIRLARFRTESVEPLWYRYNENQGTAPSPHTVESFSLNTPAVKLYIAGKTFNVDELI
jgi:hypothetical protein